MDDIKYWLGFSLIPGIGKVKFDLLEKGFPNMEEAWKASAGELKSSGLDDKAVEAIISGRARIYPDAEMEKLEKFKIKAITTRDPEYPGRLKEIYDYPPVLFVRGSFLPEDLWCLSIVGTRRATVYGRQVTEDIVQELVRNKITIVSGLARGIDVIAHRTALESGGRTYAVLASGLDIIYPGEHASLARDIIDRGALISEYPPGTKPKAEHFPRRNRIMSGISLGVLVIEAGEKSGALITASQALEQNREVFAIPGSILSPASRGTNRLIQEGAKLVSSCIDVLEELNLSFAAFQPEMKVISPESDTEAGLLKHLSDQPLHIDELCRLSQLPTSAVSSTLAIMELKGLVKQDGGMNYFMPKPVKVLRTSEGRV